MFLKVTKRTVLKNKTNHVPKNILTTLVSLVPTYQTYVISESSNEICRCVGVANYVPPKGSSYPC